MGTQEGRRSKERGRDGDGTVTVTGQKRYLHGTNSLSIFTVILSFLKLERERDYANVLDR